MGMGGFGLMMSMMWRVVRGQGGMWDEKGDPRVNGSRQRRGVVTQTVDKSTMHA